ncbi:hypothetical protein FOQG_08906 [Fusarium oxysporum f. sp. raphani 54005]|uniref:Uncharacterized protein n=2 Tax=Fusarium oxysporum f. sp. raphani TaxID=96318 RepID=X0BZF7_FUSOX|nr:hypothetical protein FOQG_08906 [Fusarium oxysporum f. sp. raphani 54005]KAG7427823.1 hypothetical protein Forpi1262_v010900 [Fusarium oxysporum f. sp. raphani]KAJ4044610.1 hypothetical protein NW758_006526 [Fusarium oxysporum]KAJ4086856.1 hypothetical protein NW761_008478 [Fusarium oxysporum]
MTNYSLTVRVPGRAAIQQFAQQGYKLCFASGVEREGYKVIASTSSIAPNAQFNWNDDLGIAASQSNFMEGVQVQASTNVDSIRPGQTYTLTPDYRGSVNDGGPQDGIRFNNQADRASPIVYRTINGSRAPIYVGSMQLPRGASQEIKPNNRIRVWFQRDGQSGTMIDGIHDQSIEIDMSGRASAAVVFNDDFTWSLQ